jgi:hypothetical protein
MKFEKFGVSMASGVAVANILESWVIIIVLKLNDSNDRVLPENLCACSVRVSVKNGRRRVINPPSRLLLCIP